MINDQYFVFNVLALAAGTLLIRGFFIALSGKMKVSDKTRELFSYIPAAILPAFILPATFFHQGIVNGIDGKERFLILIVSGVVFFFIRNTLLIIGLGLTLLWIVTRTYL